MHISFSHSHLHTFKYGLIKKKKLKPVMMHQGTDVCLIFQEDINNFIYDALINSKDVY